jgi:sulfatase modifying factor 1
VRTARTLSRIALVCIPLLNAEAIVIDFTTVGNPGNAADTQLHYDATSGYGSVPNIYAIGTYEVTNAQYAEFLNKVDPFALNQFDLQDPGMGTDIRGGIVLNATQLGSNPYELKPNMGDKPVNYVTFWDAARFANWLHNGMPFFGGTETGAYNLLDAYIGGDPKNIDNSAVTRNPNALFWIPSENEWYKAAYHDPVNPGADARSTDPINPDLNNTANYWFYPTQSDAVPIVATASATGNISNPGVNVVNYQTGADWNAQDGNVTTVGSAGPLSASHYGTFDQGGNVMEWNDTRATASTRGLRGGAWFDLRFTLQSATRQNVDPTNAANSIGFRVATVPEPTVAGMLMLGTLVLLAGRRRS